MSERDDAGSRPPLGFWDLGVAVERKAPSDGAREKRASAPPAEQPPSAPGFTVRFASVEDAGLLLGLLIGLKLCNPNVLGALGDRTEAIIAALGGLPTCESCGGPDDGFGWYRHASHPGVRHRGCAVSGSEFAS